MRIAVLLLLACLLTGCGSPQETDIQRSPAPRIVSESPKETPSEEPSTEPASPQEEEQPPQPVVLSVFSTPILNQEENHFANLQLACQAINGMVLEPGATFSFNETVGQASVKRGYRMAPVIVNGKTEQGEGGGVCQVSSTLFNAAQAAGMTVLERHDHGAPVGYVEQGQDAAISYGTYDLRFRNDTQNAVTIYIWVASDRVTAQINGS